MNTSKILNEKGGSAVKIIAITLIVLLLFGGAITIYFQYFAKDTFSEEEIADDIKLYLIEQAKLYRDALSAQQNKSQAFFTTNKDAFNLLADVDPYASPVNRP